MALIALSLATHGDASATVQYDDATLRVSRLTVRNPKGIPFKCFVQSPSFGTSVVDAGVVGTRTYTLATPIQLTATGLEFPRFLFPAGLALGTMTG